SILLSFTIHSPSCTYPLSLHDALPISVESITSRCRLINLLGNPIRWYSRMKGRKNPFRCHRIIPAIPRPATSRPIHTPGNNTPRSEEHTSELQSRSDLVCRLLLEKKKK